jgi:RNA-directed DNA polymerase
VNYTRYADDLTFSGPADLSTPRLVRAVSAIAQDEGFALNTAKTRVRPAATRQLVTGVVVNSTPGVPREDRERLRAVSTTPRCTAAKPRTEPGIPTSAHT